ncbi:hypothetical protein N9250_01810, partial [bacterium]|nr:hypothetical protein [bacterium]
YDRFKKKRRTNSDAASSMETRRVSEGLRLPPLPSLANASGYPLRPLQKTMTKEKRWIIKHGNPTRKRGTAIAAASIPR